MTCHFSEFQVVIQIKCGAKFCRVVCQKDDNVYLQSCHFICKKHDIPHFRTEHSKEICLQIALNYSPICVLSNFIVLCSAITLKNRINGTSTFELLFLSPWSSWIDFDWWLMRRSWLSWQAREDSAWRYQVMSCWHGCQYELPRCSNHVVSQVTVWVYS